MPEKQELKAFPGNSSVQVIETRVRDSSIESVVVYQDRAEVRRLLPVHLCAGENEVIVYDLADCVDKNSIRVEGTGNAVITDVIYSSKTTSEEEQTTTGSKEEYERMKVEIDDYQKELQQLKLQKQSLSEKIDLLTRFADQVTGLKTVKDNESSPLAQFVNMDNVSAVMDFFKKVESQISDSDSRQLSVRREAEAIREKIAVLHANADKVNPERKKLSSDETVRTLHVGLEAAVEGDATLIVSYVVSNASWSSTYDVRVFTKDKTMKVQYYGLIKQQTGEDWENAMVSLSTAQPSVGGSAPSLPTRIVRFKRPKPRLAPKPPAPPPPLIGSALPGAISRGAPPPAPPSPPRGALGRQSLLASIGGWKQLRGEQPQAPDASWFHDGHIGAALSRRSNAMAASDGSDDWGGEYGGDLSDTDEDEEWGEPAPPPPSMGLGYSSYKMADDDGERSVTPIRSVNVSVTKVDAGLFNTTYAIPRATTIPADNTEHKVTVALIDLSPEFTYSSVPRLSPYSFLQAKAKNSSPYTVLAGPANVFLDNNFIAKSELSDVSPNEKFTTSLGADQSIRITCQPVATVSNTRTAKFGGAKTDVVKYTHIFVVKNMRKDSVQIKVSEQVPLSTDDRIKVSVTQPDLRKTGAVCPLPFGRAVLNESNNIEWHAEVGAGSELDLKLVYTVEHPAQDGVDGLPK